MVTTLNGYSLGIVKFVTSDETGLQRTCKFPPRLAEIVEACDAAAAKLDKINRYTNFGRNNEPPLVKGPRPSMEELTAKHGGSLLPADFGAIDPVDAIRQKARDVREKALTLTQIEAFYEHDRAGKDLAGEVGTRRSARFR